MTAKRRRTPKQPLMVAVSDATGETAEQCSQAALAQFGQVPEGSVRLFSHVRDEETLERTVAYAKDCGAVLVYTLVGSELRGRIKKLTEKYEIRSVDLLGGIIHQLGRQLDRAPLAVPGLGHELDEDYFRRIEAVEFAVYNDDGKIPANLTKAEIVVVGISRTSKTPLSNYIAHRGYKVANVPIILDMDLPREMSDVDPQRVFGLVIDAVTLMNIRKARMEALRMQPDAGYGDLRQIRREIGFARKTFDAHPEWTIVDISRKAIEETASWILDTYRSRFESNTGRSAP